MRNDIDEVIREVMGHQDEEVLHSSFPPLFIYPGKRYCIRLISKPLTYFLNISNFIFRPDPPKFVEWSDQVLNFQPSVGYVKADADELYEACCDPDEKLDLKTGQRWNAGDKPPENGVVQRFRIAIFDRNDENKLKYLDFGGELFARFQEWKDNFAAESGGPLGCDWVIKPEAHPSRPIIRYYANHTCKAPFIDSELNFIKSFSGGLKDVMLELAREHTPDEIDYLKRRYAQIEGHVATVPDTYNEPLPEREVKAPASEDLTLNQVTTILCDVQLKRLSAEQILLARYKELTGKDRPEFMA